MNFDKLIADLKCSGLTGVEVATENGVIAILNFLQAEAIPALEAKFIASESKMDDLALPVLSMAKSYMPALQALILQYVDQINSSCTPSKPVEEVI